MAPDAGTQPEALAKKEPGSGTTMLPEVPLAPLWMWAQRSGAATPVTFLKLQQT
jgi:hypothetical protein